MSAAFQSSPRTAALRSKPLEGAARGRRPVRSGSRGEASARARWTCRVVRVAALAGTALLGGCLAPTYNPGTRAPLAGEVTVIAPRCVGATSCVLGHVTAAETGAPLSRAAIFLEDTGGDTEEGEGGAPVILALTDEQGVFTIVDPPPGHYRLAIYARARKAEVRGLEIAADGTTMVPVRLASGAL